MFENDSFLYRSVPGKARPTSWTAVLSQTRYIVTGQYARLALQSWEQTTCSATGNRWSALGENRLRFQRLCSRPGDMRKSAQEWSLVTLVASTKSLLVAVNRLLVRSQCFERTRSPCSASWISGYFDIESLHTCEVEQRDSIPGDISSGRLMIDINAVGANCGPRRRKRYEECCLSCCCRQP